MVLSIISIFIANTSNKIYSEEISLTHRPYVCALTFASLINDKYFETIETVKIEVANSPAHIFSEVYKFYFVNSSGKYEQICMYENNNRFVYPSANAQYTFTIQEEDREKILKKSDQGYKVYREVSIKYKMLSSPKEYMFNAIWKLDNNTQKWTNIKINAN